MKSFNLFFSGAFALLLAAGCSNEKPSAPAVPAAVTNQSSATPSAKEVAVITTSEGVMVGADDGEAEGCGVGRPWTKVGASVGFTVGALDGLAEGSGVGTVTA